MTRAHPPFRQMRQFKAVAADWEYFLSLSDEGRLYCLSDRQVYILLVQCEYIGWLTRWYNTEDITQNTVQLVQSEVMNALMSCVDISILVDQGKLQLTRNVQQQQIQSQQLRDGYAEEYDGSPTSINPDAPTTDFGSTGDRYDALCAALMAFVYQFAKGQIEAIVAGDAAAFALLAGAALLLIPGLNLFYIAGAAIALIAGGGIIGVATGTAVAALQDTTALDNVVCFIRDTIKAESVTEANWSACLDSYPFSVGSHEAIICDFIKPTLADNYFVILDMLGQAYSGTINGEPLPACPCDTLAWCRHLDAAHDLGTLFTGTGGLGAQALWDGSKWVRNDAIAPGRITIGADMGATYAITSIRIVRTAAWTGGDTNETVLYAPTFATVIDTAAIPADLTFSVSLNVQTFQIDEVSSFLVENDPIGGGITDMYISGTGTAPTWGEAC